MDSNDEEIGFCPICANVSEECIDEILGFAKKVNFETGQYLYMQNDDYKGIYVVLGGEIRLSSQNENGKEFFVKRLSRGQVVGETAVINERCLESALAVKTSKCIFLPGPQLHDLAKRNAVLSATLFGLLGQWVFNFYDRFQTLSFVSVRKRVVYYLSTEAQKENKSSVSLQLRRHEIASNLGIRPETLSRVLAELQKEELITINNNTINLINMSALTR